MLELIKFSEHNLDKTYQWMQDEKLKSLFMLEKNISKLDHQVWYENLKEDESQVIYAINYEDVHVGNLGFKNIDLKNKKAEIWIYLGDYSYRGKGIAKKALLELEKIAPSEINKIYANIANYNSPSLNTFIALDYKIEGLLIEEMVYKEKFVNVFKLYKLL